MLIKDKCATIIGKNILIIIRSVIDFPIFYFVHVKIIILLNIRIQIFILVSIGI